MNIEIIVTLLMIGSDGFKSVSATIDKFRENPPIQADDAPMQFVGHAVCYTVIEHDEKRYTCKPFADAYAVMCDGSDPSVFQSCLDFLEDKIHPFLMSKANGQKETESAA